MAGLAQAESAARLKLGSWLDDNRAVVELVVAALLGTIVFPIVFVALGRFDVRLNGRFSVVDLMWLLCALVACVFMLRARATLGRRLTAGVAQLMVSLPDRGDPRDQPTTGTTPSRSAGDSGAQGSALARGLLDLLLLLLIQASLRQPLIGVVGDESIVARVDGGYVVVVVLVALVILVNLYRAGQPLAERLTWVALDQFVPTAGFAAPSAAATFQTRLATTSRPATATPTPLVVARPIAAIPSSTESPTVTEAAPPTGAATVLDASAVADAPAPVASPTEGLDETLPDPGPPTSSDDATVPDLTAERPPSSGRKDGAP